MKYNIPARTLRDWMKRLNIKSVFTHNHSTTSSSSSSSNQNQNDTPSSPLNIGDTSTMLKKNSVSVTSVQGVEPSIAIKDMKKLKSTNTSEHDEGTTLSPKNSFGNGDGIMNLAVKVEEEDDDDMDAKTKQV